MINSQPIHPLKLTSNRVWRTYTGGLYLEQWQKKKDAADGDYPEEWIASTIRAKSAGREQMVEGLSQIQSCNDPDITLKALIESDPDTYLGAKHAAVFGKETALLVKLLDSAERLTIQVHPDLTFAEKHFQSRFGKTEAWLILGGRTINGEAPYVLLGFKPGVTRERWRSLFEQQDIQGMYLNGQTFSGV